MRCAELIATGTNRYPDLGAWISVGGWPVFTRNALAPVTRRRRRSSRSTRIPPAPDLLKAGKVAGAARPEVLRLGQRDRSSCSSDVHDGKRPPTPIIDSGVDVVTAKNVDDYMAQWKKMDSGK